jgi:hypothetical protein
VAVKIIIKNIIMKLVCLRVSFRFQHLQARYFSGFFGNWEIIN